MSLVGCSAAMDVATAIQTAIDHELTAVDLNEAGRTALRNVRKVAEKIYKEADAGWY